MAEKKKIVTRIAPSPTGFLHLGTARTALFNFLFAKHNGGKFVLRIEDTDKERSKQEYEENILEGLKWLGIAYDDFCRQSERSELHKKYIKKLVDEGRAYVSKEEAAEGKRSEVIRFKNSGKNITFKDKVKDEITFNTAELGDFIIAKSMDEPLYNLAVVVDDMEMGITHVIRGEDHISNTPRQMLIAEALGIEHPIYAHLPIVLAVDRSKLSKRHGATSITEYREMGYLPEAMVNFLVLLGWSPQNKEGKGEEILLLDDLIKKFELEKVGKSGAIFNIEKLNWLNREHIKRLEKDRLWEYVKEAIPSKIKELPEWSEERLKKITPLLIDRIVKFSEITEMAENGELDLYFKAPNYEISNFLWKKDADGEIIKSSINGLIQVIENIPTSSFSKEGVKSAVMSFIGEKDRGSILWPMRYALSGMEKSPDPFNIAVVIGKSETVARLKTAALKLGEI